MTSAPGFLRRMELALWAIGISMLGVVLGATYDRWSYQAQQERALLQNATPDIRAAEPIATPQRTSLTDVAGPVGPLALVGPPSPAVAQQRDDAAARPRAIEKKRAATVDPSVFGRIEIPRIGVAAVVREGADEATLARAVGLVPGAARPGENGNVVLAGHRDTFFRRLRKIEVNDRIRVQVPPNTYEYRVDSVRVVSPEETSVLQSKGVDELTLVTCYPFRFIGPAPDRFIVSAVRVN